MWLIVAQQIHGLSSECIKHFKHAVNMRICYIISRIHSLFRKTLSHRGISFKHANRWEPGHKCLIETLLSLWIRDQPCALDDRMSSTVLQIWGMSSSPLTGLLHKPPLQVQLIQSGYEWQEAASKWPSAHEWKEGTSEEWQVRSVNVVHAKTA